MLPCQTEEDALTNWKKTTDMAKYCILASVSATMHHLLEKINFAYEMMLQLDDMFMLKEDPRRQKLMT